MINVERQEESLETLKLMNAATTAIRLYPEGSSQISQTFEKAYQGTKAFLRKHDRLHFSLLSDPPRLQGEPVDKRTQEILLLLTFDDRLRKMNLRELVLEKGFDRQKFKNIIAVLASTPDQVAKAGGAKSFIEKLGVASNFPDRYFAPGESEGERQQKAKVEGVVKELSAGCVRREHMLCLLGKETGETAQKELQHIFAVPQKAIHVVAATTYFLLQLLQKDHAVIASPIFSRMIQKSSSLLPESQFADIAGKTAALLADHLDEASVLMFSCQEFPTAFGEQFYNAQIQRVTPSIMKNVLHWMEMQQEKGKKGEKVCKVQLTILGKAYARLLETSRIKQIKAAVSTEAVLASSEKERKVYRVQAAVAALAKGEMDGLVNGEIRHNLAPTIEKLLANGKESVALAILQNMVTGFKDKNDPLRPYLVQSISVVAMKLADMGRWRWLEKLVPLFLAWIRESEIADQSYKNYLIVLQKTMNKAWQHGNDNLAESILDTFYYIRSGELHKSKEIQGLVGRIQDRGVDAKVLQVYLERCFMKPVDDSVCNKICMQGPVAADFLIEILLESENRADRIRLLKILTGVKTQLPPLLKKRLDEPMPWYGKRNIIRLLTETGTGNDVVAVLKYVVHDDLRVSKEALNCIVTLGGELTQQYLLQVLPQASMQVKNLVMKELKRVADAGVIEPLAELLEECKAYSGSEKDELVAAICRILGATGEGKAARVLQSIVDAGGKGFGKKSMKAATQAISLIDEKFKVKDMQYQELHGKEKPVVAYAPENEETGREWECITADPEEEKVYELVEKGNMAEAKQLLFSLIEKTIQMGRFNTAETLRMRLIKIDPMSLSEIIKAAEMIEEAKTASIDQDHIAVWSDLYTVLSTEEFNTFYHSLQHKQYASETVIVHQGDKPEGLFFVNKGKVKLSFRDKGNETLITVLGPGQVFGGTTFFDESMWTLNARSMGAVEVSCLTVDNLDKWAELYPSLEPRLQEFCMRFDAELVDFFLNSGADRREEPRHPFSGSVRLFLLDEQGKNSKTTLRGDGSDISHGGVSFSARISQRKHSRTLLGRKVQLSLDETVSGTNPIVRTGIILAIRTHRSVELEHSVHICFDERLSNAEVQRLRGRK